MLSLLGVFNFIWGEFSHSQWAKKLSIFILPIFVLFNGIILVSYKDLNLSTSELLMVVLGLSVFVNQLIYKSDKYLECHKELFLMYLLLASTNVHFSGLLLAAYLFGTKKEYLTIGFANLIIFSSLLSLFHWWDESWSDMSSLAIYSLLLTYLFFKMKRDRKFEILSLSVSLLIVHHCKSLNHPIIIGFAGLSLLDLIRNMGSRKNLTVSYRLIVFYLLAFFNFLSLPVIVMFSFLCLQPLETSREIKIKENNFNISSRKLLVTIMASLVFLYLLPGRSVLESTFLITSLLVISAEYLFRNDSKKIQIDDLIFILVLIITSIVWAIYG